jgi:hypothetical protein
LTAKTRAWIPEEFWQIWVGSEPFRKFEDMSRKMIEGRLILCGIEPVKSLELKSRTSSFGKWNSEKGSESLRKLWERLRVLS